LKFERNERIEQLQYTGAESTQVKSNKIKLGFNHPVKELVWVVQKESHVAAKDWFNFSDGYATVNPELSPVDGLSAGAAGGFAGLALNGFSNGKNPVDTCRLTLNGHDRLSERDGNWFSLVVPYQCHENIPATGINVLSFALKPEEHQPSGTCNFSRIDQSVLQLNLTDNALKDLATSAATGAQVKVFALGYNVLRCMSGIKVWFLIRTFHNLLCQTVGFKKVKPASVRLSLMRGDLDAGNSTYTLYTENVFKTCFHPG